MKTRMDEAKEGKLPRGLKGIFKKENLDEITGVKLLSSGRLIAVANRKRKIKPLLIGEGVRVKVNANIGTSPDVVSIKNELEKLEAALKAGTDAVMDLSTGGDIDGIRKEIVQRSPVPVGTVPIYQAAIEAAEKFGTIVKMSSNQIFETIEKHLEDGVDFITVHVGVTQRVLEILQRVPRRIPSVSRGGTFLLTWMAYNKKENPLYEEFDRLLKIARKYDAVLSLGDGMRPGAIEDASDPAQIQEMVHLSELAFIAWEHGVQVMIEGPGHVPMDEIEMTVKLQKKMCRGAPFYVLGPLPTDIATPYDHIAASAGAAVAAAAGADFLCYVTASEHVRLPSPKDVYEGVIATRIAAHIGDLARGRRSALQLDIEMGKARALRNWKVQEKLSIDPEKFRQMRQESPPSQEDTCTMCGKFCALRFVEHLFKKK